MERDRTSEVIQAVTNAVNSLKHARKALGNIEPNDEYMWLELAYMLTNTYRNLEGFLKVRLEGEQTRMFD